MRRIQGRLRRISPTCDRYKADSTESAQHATHPGQIPPNQSNMQRIQARLRRISPTCDTSKADSTESVQHAAHPGQIAPNQSNMAHPSQVTTSLVYLRPGER